MPILEITVTARLDGVMVPGTPLIRRLSVDEAQSFDVERATGGGYVALPTGELGEINALLVRSDKVVTLRLDGQSDAGIVFKAGGFILLCDVTVDAGASTNATLDNSSGSTAAIKGLAAGT